MSTAENEGVSLRHLSVVSAERAAGEYDRLVRKLRAAGYVGQQEDVGDDFKCLCPLHENTGRHAPSLHVTKKDDGGVWVWCGGRCERGDVWSGIMADDAVLPMCRAEKISTGKGDGGILISGLEIVSEKMYRDWCRQESTETGVAESGTYIYRSPFGVSVAAKVKWTNKEFTWLHWNGQSWRRGLKGESVPLYRSDEIADSVGTVFVVEGEKDADRLAANGLAATSSVVVTRDWSQLDVLEGRVVVVIPDRDDAGDRNARRFAIWATRKGAAEVRLMAPPGDEGSPDGYDISDWLDAGGTVQELEWMASNNEEVEIIEDETVADSGDGDQGQNEQEDDGLEQEIERLAAAGVTKKLAERRRDEILRKMESAKGRRLDVAVLLSSDRPTARMGRLVDENGAETGQGVFFDGMYNAVFGPPGTGKSWIGILCLAQELKAGHHVVFFTYELPGVEVVDRLARNFGVSEQAMIDRLHLFDDKTVLGEDALDEVMELSGGVAPRFVLIDSIREALSKGSGSYSDTEISKLIMDEMANPFTKLGACVVSIDHTGHSTEDRQAGSNAKGAVVQGAMYRIMRGSSVPFSRGRRGYTAFKIAKNNVGKLPWERDGDSVSFYLRADGGDEHGEGMEFSLGENNIRLSAAELAQRAEEHAGGAADDKERAIFEYFGELGVGVVVSSKHELAVQLNKKTGTGVSTWKRRITSMLSRGALVELEGGGLALHVEGAETA